MVHVFYFLDINTWHWKISFLCWGHVIHNWNRPIRKNLSHSLKLKKRVLTLLQCLKNCLHYI